MLAGATLRGASLVCAVFIRTDLSGADLTDADFMHAALNEADLGGANLAGALFRRAVLGRCRHLDGARGVGEAVGLELASVPARP